MMLSADFHIALNDYLFLLKKKYPSKTIMNLVATRYSLSSEERSILFRGVMLPEIAEVRRSKLVEASEIKGKEVHADAMNVLLTIFSYLRGNQVYIALDGLLRDTSEYHGRQVVSDLLDKSTQLLFSFLLHYKIKKINFYVDDETDLSKELLSILENEDLPTLKKKIVLLASADHLLKKPVQGIVATSDSDILDRNPGPFLDLPRCVLEYQYKPDFLVLSNLLNT